MSDIYQRLDEQTKKKRKQFLFSYDVMKDQLNTSRKAYRDFYENPFAKYRTLLQSESTLVSTRVSDKKDSLAVRTMLQNDIHTFDSRYAEILTQKPVSTIVESGFGNRVRDYKEASDFVDGMYTKRTHELDLFSSRGPSKDKLINGIRSHLQNAGETVPSKTSLRNLSKIELAENAVEDYGLRPSDFIP